MRRTAMKSARGNVAKKRGVASVVAMMFLILFGSLAAAMAIASRGNIRTAATHMYVSRALSAAETGLAVGRQRLEDASSRFVVSQSDMTQSFGSAVWTGSGIPGSVTVLAAPWGVESPAPAGIVHAVANAHARDSSTVSGVSVSTPTIGNRMAGVDTGTYAATGWLYTPAVAVESTTARGATRSLCFSVTYAPLANGTDIRVIATGYDFNYLRNGAPVARTIMQDFRMGKRVRHAINSPARVMIGKNVLVSGDIGTRWTDVTRTYGDPLLMRSDFRGLDNTLDTKLADFFTAVRTSDVDGDNRLRVRHPTEGAAIPPASRDYNGDGQPDNAFADVTGDGFVDEFDIFIRHYDANGDGRVALSTALTTGTPAQGSAAEFVRSGGAGVDDDLALLIDMCNPDRNRNGVLGFNDTNRNGRWDVGETFVDSETRGSTVINRDQVLGYRDGFVDRRDQYAKLNGRLSFRANKTAWQNAQGAIPDRLQGPMAPPRGSTATAYDQGIDALPDINLAMFAQSDAALKAAANGAAFDNQVATNLGVSPGALATYVESRPAGSTQPRYLRVDPDANLDGRPDNWSTAYFEKMPFNSPSFSDWYYRPVYENMAFKDVVIPAGTNALFVNCTFAGVTYVRSHSGNTHVLWNEYGKYRLDTVSNRPILNIPRNIYGDGPGETSYPAMLPSSARPPNQMVLMATTPMDKADIPADQVATTQGYNLLPDPLIVGGLRVTDTRALSNNIRFHGCMFVGSIISDTPSTYTQVRNKIQFTGATRFVDRHPTEPDNGALNPDSADLGEIQKSSMMLPQYSVDIGHFNSPQDQNVQLRGAIIAGLLDVRGNASIEGALMLTFLPAYGQAPLIDAQGNAVGNPALFNATLGYFGPEDGDSESLDPNTLPIVGGQRIVGYDTNGDGLADLPHTTNPVPSGAVAVPFSGYGRINIRFSADMALPNGVLLPLSVSSLNSSYREGKP